MKMLFVQLVFLSLWFISVIMMLNSCSPWNDILPNSNPSFPTEFAVAGVPSEQMPSILADTITPPANPMAPEDLSAYPTYAGTLQLYPANGFNNLNGQYFCGIELENSIEVKVGDYQTNHYSALYLIDRKTKEPVRFDHPMLQSCVVGDTILVTGTPVQISDGVALGIEMYFVQ